MTSRIKVLTASGLTMLGAGLAAAPAMAAVAKPWQLGLPEPVTPIAQMLSEFHSLLLWIIVPITLFVTGLMAYACYRFRESANPNPSRTTHNVTLEIAWSLIPILILVGIAFPSFKAMYAADKIDNPEMTLKITGNQWYWTYTYPDNGNFTFDAYLLARTDEEAKELGVLRLMDTDNLVVIPTDTRIRLIVTASDVIHNWSMSDFGVRLDAVPGRLNETWTMVTKPGMYYGFCSELCGLDHAYMPIAVKAVPKPEFEAWVKQAQATFDTADGGAPEQDPEQDNDTAGGTKLARSAE